MKDEYKDVVEHHIHHTHHYAHDARHTHVAATLQHSSREVGQLEEGQHTHEHRKVYRGIAGNILSTTKPERQPAADYQSEDADNHTDREGKQQSVTKHRTRLLKVISPNEVRHLHAEAHRGG